MAEQSMKIAICGGPRTGKTTFAKRLGAELGLRVVSTDQFIKFAWDVVPDMVIAELAPLSGWILEGVQAARVLRRWFNSPPSVEKPSLHGVYWLEKSFSDLSDGQRSLGKGVATVFADVRPILRKLGVPIFPGLPSFHPTAAAQ